MDLNILNISEARQLVLELGHNQETPEWSILVSQEQDKVLINIIDNIEGSETLYQLGVPGFSQLC